VKLYAIQVYILSGSHKPINRHIGKWKSKIYIVCKIPLLFFRIWVRNTATPLQNYQFPRFSTSTSIRVKHFIWQRASWHKYISPKREFPDWDISFSPIDIIYAVHLKQTLNTFCFKSFQLHQSRLSRVTARSSINVTVSNSFFTLLHFIYIYVQFSLLRPICRFIRHIIFNISTVYFYQTFSP